MGCNGREGSLGELAGKWGATSCLGLCSWLYRELVIFTFFCSVQ